MSNDNLIAEQAARIAELEREHENQASAIIRRQNQVAELEAELLQAYNDQRTNAEQLAVVREFCAEYSHSGLVDTLRDRMLWADSPTPAPTPRAEAGLKGVEDALDAQVLADLQARLEATIGLPYIKPEPDLGPGAATLSIPELLPMLAQWPELLQQVGEVATHVVGHCSRLDELERKVERPAQLSKRTWRKLNKRIDDTAGNLRAQRDERITGLENAVSGLRGRADKAQQQLGIDYSPADWRIRGERLERLELRVDTLERELVKLGDRVGPAMVRCPACDGEGVEDRGSGGVHACGACLGRRKVPS